MKVLQLRFKNLNSLAGEWQIDLTDPAFAAEGIFAITGPTGAGKSSILDALCLALYGRTPRLGKITKTSNEIMSRQTGECFAEVTFVTAAGRYRCHWSQHRSRKRADGELQQPKQEIANADSGEILETRLRDVEDAVVRVTGMDFDRFTRSVLLAQGGFAAFLQAGADARAPILEQITGTEIYSRISIRTHEMQREQRDRLRQLEAQSEGIRLLTPEQLQALALELEHTGEQEQQLAVQVATLEASIQWLQTVQQLENQLAGLQQEQQQLEQQQQAFVPEQARLTLALQAAELEPARVQLQQARQVLAGNDRQLTEDRARLPQLEQQLAASRTAQQAQVTQLEQARAAQSAMLPVLREVRLLDQQLQQQRQRLLELQQDEHSAEQALQVSMQQLGELQQQQQRDEQTAAGLDAWLQERAADQWLVSGLAGVEQQIRQLQALQEQLQQQQQNQQRLAGDWQAADRQREQQRGRWRQEQQSLQQAVDKRAVQQQQLAALLDGRSLREYRNEREHLQEKRELLARIQSLEEQRQHLHDGQPCPLCGATMHPYAEGRVPQPDGLAEDMRRLDEKIHQIERQDDICRRQEQEVQRLQLLFNEAEKAGLALTARCTALQDNLDTGQQALERQQAMLEAQQQQVAGVLQPLGVQPGAEADAGHLLQQLQQRRDRWLQQQDSRQQLASRQQQHLAGIAHLQSLMGGQEQSLNACRHSLQAVQQAQALLQQQRESLLGQRDADTEEQQLQQQVAAADGALQQGGAGVQHLEQQQAGLQERIALLEQRLADSRDSVQQADAQFAGLLQQQGFAGEQAMQEASLPAAERQQLQQRAKQLEQQHVALQTRLQDVHTRLHSERQRALTTEQLEDVQQRLPEASSNLRQLRDQLVTLRLQQQQDTAARGEQAQALLAIEQQRVECRRWDNLHALIGSADGKKFRNFAQGLTFELMVAHANRTLQHMSDRYLLVRDSNEPLELNVMDNYQAGEVRSTKNLSGGESFIVSLALALGLSRMASQNVRVDSLFLDEGFGTLDEEALDVALDTLAGLQQDGKLIGVISHVPALKERLATQIRVRPLSSGRSRLEGPGCLRLS